MLDHADRLLEDGTLTLDPPNAATVQILATVRLLGAFEDLSECVETHATAAPAKEMFPHYPAQLPRFLDPAWLEPVRAGVA